MGWSSVGPMASSALNSVTYRTYNLMDCRGRRVEIKCLLEQRDGFV